MRSKIENGEALLDGKDFAPISYAWMFGIFRYKYQGTEGGPIVRIVWEFRGIGEVIYRGLESGVRNPEGVWGWLGEKK